MESDLGGAPQPVGHTDAKSSVLGPAGWPPWFMREGTRQPREGAPRAPARKDGVKAGTQFHDRLFALCDMN